LWKASPSPSASGRRMIRGNERGARTIAMWPSRPKASRPCSNTTTFNDLLRIFGNGCAVSSPSGDSTGMISLRKCSRSQSVCSGVQCRRCSRRMPWSFSAGRSSWSKQRYCASTSSAARSWMRLSRTAGASPSAAIGPPNSMAWRTEPPRISKNSSRLVQEMHRNFSRSSSGTAGSCACASTRKLKSSCDSSRLAYSEASGTGALWGGDGCDMRGRFMAWRQGTGWRRGDARARRRSGN